MTVGEIHRAFDQLRHLCDPQGHDLLEALELALITQQTGLDRVDGAMQVLAASETIDRLPNLKPIVNRPVALDPEAWGHSRRVDLEVIQ